MKGIGGFFELETGTGTEYHTDALKLNTGRNAFEYLLRVKKYSKVYLPYYICHSVLEPLDRLGIKYSFYQINQEFEAKFDFTGIGESEVFLYVNYFGICDFNVQQYVKLSKELNFNICIDNTQSFFSKPHDDIDTFYSPRKFFGVPDGAYLYTNQNMTAKIEQGVGYDKSTHLLKRIDVGPNEAYNDYKKVSLMHKNQEIKKMSLLSQSILSSLNYPSIKERRLTNFKHVHQQLKGLNSLSFGIEHIIAPMVYPLFIQKKGLRNYLISKNIFVATYWNDVLNIVGDNQFERILVNNIIPIPIDQRYGLDDMEYLINIVLEYTNKE